MNVERIAPITRQEAGRIRLLQTLAAYGCIPPTPDGPAIEQFGALALAQIIEAEFERCRLVGWPKMTLHMDLQDAWMLACYLRVSASELRRET